MLGLGGRSCMLGLRTKRVRSMTVAPCLAAVAITSCVADGDSSQAPRSTVAATLATTSTLPPQPSTTLPTTTTATTLPTPTTEAPDVGVERDYLAFVNGYWLCLQMPDACDPSALNAPGSGAADALANTVRDMAGGELYMGAEPVGYAVVESVELSDSETAVVVACWWDTAVLYGPAVSAGSLPVVLNDLKVTARYESEMQLVDGIWKLTTEKLLERIEGVNQCPPDE